MSKEMVDSLDMFGILWESTKRICIRFIRYDWAWSMHPKTSCVCRTLAQTFVESVGLECTRRGRDARWMPMAGFCCSVDEVTLVSSGLLNPC